MSARDVIANRIAGPSAKNWANATIAALTAAGYRILGPDEIDPVTVERCIAIVEAKAPKDTGEWCPYREWAVGSIPYLRALTTGGER